MGSRNTDFVAELRTLIGDDAYLKLIENYGGLRTFIAKNADRSEMVEVIGLEATQKLADEFGSLYCKIPLDREFRALRYRQEGASNRQIAVRLCMTESGLERILSRVAKVAPQRVAAPRPKAKKPPAPKPERPMKAPDPRIVAIKGYFLEHAPMAPKIYKAVHLAEAFNKAHAGQYYISPSSAGHWCRWAMDEYARRTGTTGILSRRK